VKMRERNMGTEEEMNSEEDTEETNCWKYLFTDEMLEAAVEHNKKHTVYIHAHILKKVKHNYKKWDQSSD
jgi:hypothetical protein